MSGALFTAQDPRTGAILGSYSDADDETIATACRQAAAAAPALREEEPRVRLLREVARMLRAAGPELHKLCGRETGLPLPRLEGELERTCVQLELLADVVAEGSYVEAMIDTADPVAPIAPRPDLRRTLIPIGPVAVFGASNFPYAFSVAGGDTASALAAGCPVVVKAHPSHPGTSGLVAAIVLAAVEEVGLPHGTFSLVHGASSHVGEALARAEEIEAVAFTGSLAGGRALFDVAASRPRPIPVFAEMGSVNPTLITTAALQARAAAVAEGLTASVTGGTGQFCTKPGVVLVPADDAGSAFVDDVVGRLAAVEPAPLLNARIHSALREAVAELDDDTDVQRLSSGGDAGENRGAFLHTPVAYAVDGDLAARRPDLLQERFGPLVLFVRYAGIDEASEVLDALEGQLTATVHAEGKELDGLRPIISRLEQKAGRVVFDGFPTGVAVTHAMQHGGPYPATTAPAHTSVGTTAIRRFQRPVTWQNAPAAVLPAALQDDNPLGIWRVVNGQLTRDPL
ncbi:MAG TPA: aldehyde dehydrogenase (NADP(+)) [Solirubrobacteraceae bacterium]|nr:aldehyde dehydrogenase (NADP(+)) [Solirubrobacteraceae bacterium]